jgi:multidrug resistance efflux pump
MTHNYDQPSSSSGGVQPPRETDSESRRKPSKSVMLLLISLLLAVVAGYLYWAVTFRDVVSTDDAFLEARQTRISSLIPGKIVSLNVAEGDNVQAGDTLAVIEGSDQQSSQLNAASTGVVARLWASSGETIQPGQPILTVYHLEEVWVRANLEETKVAKIRLGDKVEIRLDAYPHRKFNGRVALIGTATASQFSLIPPNNASGNFTKVTQRLPIKIKFEGQDNLITDQLLWPGMSAEIRIQVKGR